MEFSDCEVRDRWWFEQDVNAWTSFGYVLAATVLAVEVLLRRLPRAVYALAAVAAVEGIGSVAYHAETNDLAKLLHDAPLVGALGYITGWHAGRLTGPGGDRSDDVAERRAAADRGALTGVALGCIVGIVLWAAAPDAINAAVAAAIVVTVGASIAARRRRLPPLWRLPVVLLGAIAVAIWAAGHASSPFCDADSALQWHGVWHVLTALLLIVWVDAAYGADDPATAPRLLRRATDRVLGLLTIALVRVFHRSVDVKWRMRLPSRRPVLVVANHGNGFVDPIVLASVLGRLPRFIAKATLWKVPIARPFLALAGVLPVYRSSDGDRSSKNRSVFAACHREFETGATVAIFPEGTTGDRAGLDRVKSGAARIALGAVPTSPQLEIVPIGLAFENRVEMRSRAVVIFGEPIRVADTPGAPAAETVEPDPIAVRSLTDRITTALEAVSPSFASVEEREVLRAAARVALEDDAGPTGPSFGDVEVLARELARGSSDDRGGIIDAYRRYATRLQLIGVSADQVRPERPSTGRLVASLVGAVLGGTLLAFLTMLYLPAIALVVVATALVRSTATKGTVRLLVGLIAGLATVVVSSVVLADGWGTVVTAALVAAGGLAALFVWPPLVRTAITLAGWLRVRDRTGLLDPVLAERATVIAAVDRSRQDQPMSSLSSR